MNSGLQPESRPPFADAEPRPDARGVRNVVVGAIWSLPWVFLALTYLMAPGFMIPFLNHPVSRLVIIGMFVWESTGFFLLSRFGHPLVWIAVILFCLIPALVTPLLGPAVLTIIQALGPAMK